MNILPTSVYFLAVLAALAPAVAGPPVYIPAEPWPENQPVSITLFFPDDDPFLFNGQWLLLPRGDQAYRVRVPPGYYRDRQRRYPALFVVGAGSAKLAGPWGSNEWVVIEIPGAAAAAPEQGLASFICALNDVRHRLRLAPGLGLIRGAGATAARAAQLAAVRPDFAGVLFEDPAWPAPDTAPAAPLAAFWRQAPGRLACFVLADGAGDRDVDRWLGVLPTNALVTVDRGADAAAAAVDRIGAQLLYAAPDCAGWADYYRAEFRRRLSGVVLATGSVQAVQARSLIDLAERHPALQDAAHQAQLETLRPLAAAAPPP